MMSSRRYKCARPGPLRGASFCGVFGATCLLSIAEVLRPASGLEFRYRDREQGQVTLQSSAVEVSSGTYPCPIFSWFDGYASAPDQLVAVGWPTPDWWRRSKGGFPFHCLGVQTLWR